MNRRKKTTALVSFQNFLLSFDFPEHIPPDRNAFRSRSMFNLKLFSLCFAAAFFVAFVISGGDGGTGAAKNAVQNGDYEAVVAIKGEIWCPEKGIDKKTNKTVGTKCDGGSFAHYYDCCGSGNAECCFALQLWVYITLGVITLISIISTIAGLLCCCCKK